MGKLDYGKYKPITVPGKCNICLQKTIFKSYRTVCDKCATDKKICTKCGKDSKRYADMPEEMQKKLKDDNDNMNNYLKKLRESSRRMVKRLSDQELIYWSIANKKFVYLEDDEMSDDGIDVEEMQTRKRLKSS